MCDAVLIFTLFSVFCSCYACTEINMLLDLTAFALALLRLIFKVNCLCLYFINTSINIYISKTMKFLMSLCHHLVVPSLACVYIHLQPGVTETHAYLLAYTSLYLTV